jgi:hypothetical protein
MRSVAHRVVQPVIVEKLVNNGAWLRLLEPLIALTLGFGLS